MIQCSICKANNEDRSLFCLECGQRLKPHPSASQDIATADVLPAQKIDAYQSSSKLHSPMLDMGTQLSGRKNKLNGNQYDVPENVNVSNNSRSMGISRNGLHSPLLDNKNYFTQEPQISETDMSAGGNFRTNGDKSRLHSPVLDGPISAGSFMGRSRNGFVAEEQEYESLRSPLLESKVPLPDLSIDNTKQESRPTLQSIIGQSSNVPFKGQSGATNKATAPIQREEKRQALNVSQSLLPADRDDRQSQSKAYGENSSSISKVMIVALIILAVGFKVWFLTSLGNTLFSSAPFAFDQAGQIIAMLSILIIALKVRN